VRGVLGFSLDLVILVAARRESGRASQLDCLPLRTVRNEPQPVWLKAPRKEGDCE